MATTRRSRTIKTELPSLGVLRIAVEEQRRFHDELTNSFKSQAIKTLTFIGATLALLTFLYAGAYNNTTPPVDITMSQRLFIPPQLYGIIFYAVGLVSILYALAKLIHGARPGAKWGVPFEQKDFKDLSEDDERQYLIKLKDEYVLHTEANLKTHAGKHGAFRDSFYPLIIGAIILVVLRYFQ